MTSFLNSIAIRSASRYLIEKSLRFRATALSYLSRTHGLTRDSATTFTFSCWVKRGALDATGHNLLGGNSGTAALTVFRFDNDDTLHVWLRNSSSVTQAEVNTQAVFRDVSKFMHVVFVYDTSNATQSERLRIFVNGVRQALTITSNFALNQQPNGAFFGNMRIGNFRTTSNGGQADMQLAEPIYVDGLALDAEHFGKIDPVTGEWVEKKYTGDYGTIGFHLDFKDTTSLTTLGYDVSGNNNHWTLNSFSLTAGVTYDSSDDVPSNSFATINQNQGVVGTISEVNQRLTCTASAYQSRSATIAVDSGKWYWEVTVLTGGNYISIGVAHPNLNLPSTRYIGQDIGSIGYFSHGYKYKDILGGNSAIAYGATYTTNDVIGVALDLDTGTIEYFKNGVSQGVAFSGISGLYAPAFSVYTSGRSVALNCGQRPFAYTPPEGFLSLCTQNLPTPTIKKSSKSFGVVLYAGDDAASQEVDGLLFSPDLLWIKNRTAANSHLIQDSVRGANNYLSTDTTNAEGNSAVLVQSFDNDGFTVGYDSTDVTNGLANSYVAWAWLASVGVLSIETYTGNGSARTISHGLGAVPALMIVKALDVGSTNWALYHHKNTANPRTIALLLNSNGLNIASAAYWNNIAPTDTEFSVGTHADVNSVGSEYIAYLFAEVEGFSKFGAYEGNNSANGTFVYTGFRPAFILIKRVSSAAGAWILWDAERNVFNVMDDYLVPNLAQAETQYAGLVIDRLANGVKMRGTQASINAANSYIFIAFAESPLKYANAV